jgi:LemA protein
MNLPVIIILGLVAVVVVWALLSYNGLVRARLRVREAWSAVQVQLQRRADLIPNLVETVKGYVAHERGTLEAVTRARAALQSATTPAAAAEANNMLTQTLRSLFAVAEAYPELRANQNFLQLQGELGETEDKVAYARNYYNGAVEQYNGKVQTVPTVLVATVFGFRPAEFFAADAASAAPVRVTFS